MTVHKSNACITGFMVLRMYMASLLLEHDHCKHTPIRVDYQHRKMRLLMCVLLSNALEVYSRSCVSLHTLVPGMYGYR